MIDETGKIYGKWRVLARSSKTDRRDVCWICQCECGMIRIVRGNYLRRNRSTKCLDCRIRENTRLLKSADFHRKHHYVHGYCAGRRENPIPEYAAYNTAKYRCSNLNSPCWHNYGGRGIEFRFKSFEEFISHIGPKPDPKLTLDRINNNGHYEIGNVRWASRATQIHNSRPFLLRHKN